MEENVRLFHFLQYRRSAKVTDKNEVWTKALYMNWRKLKTTKIFFDFLFFANFFVLIRFYLKKYDQT